MSKVFASTPTAFPVFNSAAKNSPSFTANVESWGPVLKKFEDGLEWAAGEGPTRHIERHHIRGMLSARDRISLILDDESPFLELLPFAGYGIAHSSACASLIAGVGTVHGVPVMIVANIPTIAGGSMNEITVKKQQRASQIAIENEIPTVFLNQCAGANLPQQFQVFHPSGKNFRDITDRSDAGSPTCTIVFGSSTAGGAYQPGMSEFSIFVKQQAQVFLGGPPLVKMATGEVSSAEELGGADMHTSVSGVSDALAEEEFDACRMARNWVLSINRVPLSAVRGLDVIRSVREPRFHPDELLGIVPTNVRQPLNMNEVVAHMVDDSRFEPFKPLYGPGMLCCWAHIHGQLVGIIANQSPVIFTNEARKSAQFIALNNASSTPIVFLHNVTGFMVGKKAEQEGIIKAGSLLIDAVSRSAVPHFSIICGSSYGAGNYAMCGRSYAPRFLFSWPNSRCSVMGPEQLSGVMEIISRGASERSGQAVDEEKVKARSDSLRDRVENESMAWYTSAWCLDDGIIDPRDTRSVLGMCLEITRGHDDKGNRRMRGVSRL
ncbi:hypothetical protein EG329_004600 [Mollisiaceae sp. DMI_Dod_QoI]|nr:hypothetical protein EG329_004600 [Helotiales sp. DMI_Dod_QoI]